ncbi:MAG TPA: HAD family hydrolase [Candidatus Binataceae bacterium]|nr:HAD family hydrolase [Candidatus Binataceae bacterium]
MVFGTGAAGLNLIFDADDTLWESNIHFLEAEAAFIAMLERVGGCGRDAIRKTLRYHELKIIAEAGYGRVHYVTALHRVIPELAPAHYHKNLRGEVEQIGRRLLNRRCEVMPGVAETLEVLAKRHRLLLFTKGHPDEQLAKLEHSGLRRFFSRIGVPWEKNSLNYQLLLAQAELDPARTVMIGNSPRSDINPALEAGLYAVYIPYLHTWELEDAAIDHACGRVVTVTAFPHLSEVF